MLLQMWVHVCALFVSQRLSVAFVCTFMEHEPTVFDSHLPPKFILFQLLEMPPFKLERNWTSEEDRLRKRQQWLTYVTLYAEERICASCWASQFEEYLDKNLSKNWCMVV